VQDIRERLSIVADDLYWVDEEGQKKIDADAIGELSVALGEILREQLTEVKLDDFSGSDRRGSYHLSHMKIRSVIPEKITFHMETEAVIDTSISAKNKVQTELILSAAIKGIRSEVKDLHFSYAGTMLSERGVADVTIPSADLSIDFVYMPSRSRVRGKPVEGAVIPTKNNGLKFLNMRSHFHVEDLKIDYHKDTMRHEILVPLLTKVFHKYLVRQLEQGIQSAMNQTAQDVGKKMAKTLDKSPGITSFGSYSFATKEDRKRRDASRKGLEKKHKTRDSSEKKHKDDTKTEKKHKDDSKTEKKHKDDSKTEKKHKDDSTTEKKHKDVTTEKKHKDSTSEKHKVHDITSDSSPKVERQKTLESHV
jgi:hypothetical protein